MSVGRFEALLILLTSKLVDRCQMEDLDNTISNTTKSYINSLKKMRWLEKLSNKEVDTIKNILQQLKHDGGNLKTKL